MGRPEKRRPSVLSRQRPKRSQSRRKVLRSVLLLSSAMVFVGGASYFVRWALKSFQRAATEPTQWDVTVDTARAPDKPQLERKVINKISVFSSEQLKLGRPIAELAKDIQAKWSFDRVRVARTGLQAVEVQIVPRVPLLCLDLNGLRYVSEDGTVYSFVEDPKETPCPGPVLTGVSEPHGPPAKDVGVLALTGPQAESVREALNLTKAMSELGLKSRTLEWRSFRGLVLRPVPDEPEVVIGTAPFGSRLAKLKDLLSTKQGQGAERIELDFKGKAFVKMRQAQADPPPSTPKSPR